MRKLFLALLVLPFFVACNQKEIKQLKEQNAQLTQLAIEKDSMVNSFVDAMNSIEKNLDLIKEKEQIISVNKQENLDIKQKEKIANDILIINDLLARNKEDLAALDKKLKNSWYKNSKLRKMVDGLQNQIQEKETAIAALNIEVSKLNVNVEDLNGQVTNLVSTVDTLSSELENKGEIIAAQTNDLNTAYFVTGTTKDLETNQVIVKKGGLLGIGKSSTLNTKLNTEKFERIDITKTINIPVSAKKISLVSTHPSDSYRIDGTEKQVEGITILKPEEFWKASKFLVIATR